MRGSKGFTLTELLVVIGAIVLLLGVVTPNITSLLDSNEASSAVEVVSSSQSSTRAMSMRRPPMLVSNYEGSALVFGPSGSIRKAWNVDPFEVKAGRLPAFLRPEHRRRQFYRDDPNQELTYLPKGLIPMGVMRLGSGSGKTVYLPPPFALKFDRTGNLVSRKTESVGSGGGRVQEEVGYVHYDGNYDEKFGVPSKRSTSYDVLKYIEFAPEFDEKNRYGARSSEGATEHVDKIKFEFEQLEACIGVIVIKLEDYRKHGFDSLKYEIDKESREGQWIAENGEKMSLNRYSGGLLR